MLDTLPPEIIVQILGHLPTASSIVNAARTNRKIHAVASQDGYAIFKDFLRNRFPSIKTPPQWNNMACALTSRSRAWDRRSFIARECYQSEDETFHFNRNATQKFGYVPVIDSYEGWPGYNCDSRKQVLAFGAGGRLRLRVTEKDRTEWKSLRLPDDHLPINDILDVRLLRPDQHSNRHGEVMLLRRADGDLTRVESGVGKDNFTQVSKYLLDNRQIDCMDLNTDRNPLMAVCNTQSLQLFPVNAEKESIRASHNSPFAQDFHTKHRMRCMRFLDNETLATAVQFVEGRERAPILIYQLSTSGVTATPLMPSSTIDLLDHPIKGRHSANVISNIDNTASLASRPGQVFLSGWTDGISRLHDLRTPSETVAQYLDSVDDGQIISLAAVGHERFFAGSHQSACLKSFDLRMPGSRLYSYTNIQPQAKKNAVKTTSAPDEPKTPKREINIFLALTVRRNLLWAPLPPQDQENSRLPRYRGSVYSLSSPSPSSNMLFAGIENHVIQFDFVNTDDIMKKRGGLCDPTAGLSTLSTKPESDRVLSLSCYERPRSGHGATDTVLLRKQVEWNETLDGIDDARYGPAEEGWDHRWRLTRSWRGTSMWKAR